MLNIRKLKVWFTILCSMFFCENLYASDTLYFVGKIKVSKQISYDYILRFAINANQQISGYSLTDARGVNETKTKISGFYDSLKNILTFQEKSVIRSKVNLEKNDLCFVKASLKVKKTKLIETMLGKFTGSNPNNEVKCASGEIQLINTARIKLIIEEQSTKKDTTKQILYIKKNTFKDTIKITGDKGQDLPFTGTYIKFSIWDNGQVDGDMISILLNGKYILEKYTLDSKMKIIETELSSNNVDEIKIIALNEGNLPPNTATIKIESRSEQYPIQIQANVREIRKIYLHKKR